MAGKTKATFGNEKSIDLKFPAVLIYHQNPPDSQTHHFTMLWRKLEIRRKTVPQQQQQQQLSSTGTYIWPSRSPG